MTAKIKRSVVPIYVWGLVWLIWGLNFPLYTSMHYLACTIASVLVYIVAKMIFPDRAYQTPDSSAAGAASTDAVQEPPAAQPKTNPPTAEVAALIQERDRAVSEIRRLNANIQDPTISAQIDHLENMAAKILDHVAQNPEKLPQIQRFLNYYLPTTLKILNAYDRMDATGISGDNISATKAKVEGMMDTISKAFDHQLDALFGDEALDISTDITVMENMLTQEGMSGLQL